MRIKSFKRSVLYPLQFQRFYPKIYGFKSTELKIYLKSEFKKLKPCVGVCGGVVCTRAPAPVRESVIITKIVIIVTNSAC